MKKQALSHALGGAALAAFLLFAPASGAWAAQSITVPSGQTVAHSVCGNGDTANYGNTPCDSTLTSGNTVTIDSGAVVQGMVEGARNGTDANGVTGNQVTVTGQVEAGIHGGIHSRNGTADDVSASGNTVTVNSGAVVSGGIIGGYASTGSGSATASDNTVQINGGTLSGDIIGGMAASNTGTNTATGNTVTIQGNPVFAGVTNLRGGPAGGASGTNNTLNLHVAGLSVDYLSSFQTLNFYLPASLGNGGIMMTATLSANITGADISITVPPASPLKAGDEIVLIDASAGTLNGALAAGTPIPSLTAGYTFETVAATNQLRVKVLTAPVKPATSAAVPTLSEMALALLALLLAGGAVLRMRRERRG